MFDIYYYYNPVVKSHEERSRFFVDYFCTDGSRTVWAGRIVEDSPTAVLHKVRKLVSALNEPKPFWGWDGKLMHWIWWMRRN